MGESIREIEYEIAAQRDRLGRNLHELQSTARDMTDWRAYYRRHPGRVLGAALVGGAVAGVVTGRVVRGARPTGVRPRTRASSAQPHPVRQRLESEWHTISDALVGVASAKLMDFIGGKIPGFSDQIRRRS